MTLYTTNYNLDKYEGIDKPNLRDQYNSAMDKIDSVLKTQEDKQANDKQELSNKLGQTKKDLNDRIDDGINATVGQFEQLDQKFTQILNTPFYVINYGNSNYIKWSHIDFTPNNLEADYAFIEFFDTVNKEITIENSVYSFLSVLPRIEIFYDDKPAQYSVRKLLNFSTPSIQQSTVYEDRFTIYYNAMFFYDSNTNTRPTREEIDKIKIKPYLLYTKFQQSSTERIS